MRACAGRTSDGVGETGTGRETRTARNDVRKMERGSEEKRSKMGSEVGRERADGGASAGRAPQDRTEPA
jgi:hypothetical protein